MKSLFSISLSILLHAIYIIGSVQLPVIFQKRCITPTPVRVVWVTRLQEMPVDNRRSANALAQAQSIAQDLLEASLVKN